ncbi:MAG: SCP2 sterol-binding domain-containing protein [Lachnospiraceae bacterium]|nr:SCP2 sterol-binding domain-containing protein [bacterium]MDY5516101.1 SCP2 sterol-binding domain-containing protein [Lachnospiraceae bacterium]
MTYAEFFYEIKNKFMGADLSDIHEHLAFQFNIEDEEAGGIFYVEVKDGVLAVEPYEYFDRDAMFTATPDTFMKIAEGKMDPIWAFTVQKLKVEGNIDKALRLKDIIEIKQKQMKKEKKEQEKQEKLEKKQQEKQEKLEKKEQKKLEKAEEKKLEKPEKKEETDIKEGTGIKEETDTKEEQDTK